MEIAVTVWRNTAYVDQLISFKFLSAWQWTSPAQMVGQSQEMVQRLSGMSMETEGFFWQKLISAVPRVILWSTIHEISSSQAESMACPMRWSSDILLSISDEMQQKIIQLDLSETVIGYPNWISEQRCRFCNETVYIWFTVIQAHSYKGRFICICYLHVSVKTYLIDIKMQYAGEMVSKLCINPVGTE